MRDLSEYVGAWRERQRAGSRRQVVRQQDLARAAEVIADTLVRDYGATRVVLFGSVARGEAGPTSDIDLLVDGLDGEHLLQASLAAERLSVGAPVDLVPRLHARREVLARALSEGRTLRA